MHTEAKILYIENMPGRSPSEEIELTSELTHEFPEPGLNGEDIESMQVGPWHRDRQIIPCLEHIFRTDEDGFIGMANSINAGTQFLSFLFRKNNGCLPQLCFKTSVFCFLQKTTCSPLGLGVQTGHQAFQDLPMGEVAGESLKEQIAKCDTACRRRKPREDHIRLPLLAQRQSGVFLPASGTARSLLLPTDHEDLGDHLGHA